MIWRRLRKAFGINHTAATPQNTGNPTEYSLSADAPEATALEGGLAKEIFDRELWADHFINHATTIWNRENLEPDIFEVMRGVYLGSRESIVAGTFAESDVWAPIEASIIRPLVNTVTHRVYEQTFYRLESAVQDQFYSSARYAFFECIRNSQTENAFEYWLVVNPESTQLCMKRASHNPYSFDRAFAQNAKHRHCDCTWMATLKEKYHT